MHHVLLQSSTESKLTKYYPQLLRLLGAWEITHDRCPTHLLSFTTGCHPNSPTKSWISTLMLFFPRQVSNSSRHALVRCYCSWVSQGTISIIVKDDLNNIQNHRVSHWSTSISNPLLSGRVDHSLTPRVHIPKYPRVSIRLWISVCEWLKALRCTYIVQMCV